MRYTNVPLENIINVDGTILTWHNQSFLTQCIDMSMVPRVPHILYGD